MPSLRYTRSAKAFALRDDSPAKAFALRDDGPAKAGHYRNDDVDALAKSYDEGSRGPLRRIVPLIDPLASTVPVTV